MTPEEYREQKLRKRNRQAQRRTARFLKYAPEDV